MFFDIAADQIMLIIIACTNWPTSYILDFAEHHSWDFQSLSFDHISDRKHVRGLVIGHHADLLSIIFDKDCQIEITWITSGLVCRLCGMWETWEWQRDLDFTLGLVGLWCHGAIHTMEQAVRGHLGSACLQIISIYTPHMYAAIFPSLVPGGWDICHEIGQQGQQHCKKKHGLVKWFMYSRN